MDSVSPKDVQRLQALVLNDLSSSLGISGQIELIGGGWVQNDEAISSYQEIIDQMSFGLDKQRSLFGNCTPTAAWQIDPFGHSREMGSLFVEVRRMSVMCDRWATTCSSSLVSTIWNSRNG